MAGLISFGDYITRLVDIKAEALNKHFDRSLFDIEENFVLVLKIENEKLVFFICSMDWVLEHEILDVDETLFEVVVVY